MARQWFKHFCGASQGSSLRLLWDNGDYEAYGFWWQLLEMLGRFELEERPGVMVISWSMLRREVGWNKQRCSKVLAKIVQTFEIEVKTISDESFELSVPKWTELNSSWGGKRGARFEQDAGRSKKIEVRSKIVDSEQQSDDCYVALQCYSSLQEIFTQRKVSNEVQQGWAESFPDSEWVVEKIRRLLLWEKTNPGRKKKNFARFVTNCLGRDWDKRRVPAEGEKLGTLITEDLA